MGFSPNNISILADTHSPMSSSKRRANLLLSCCCDSVPVSYCFYQLQVCNSTSTDKSEQTKFIVCCSLAASGIVDCECSSDNSSIFLASASINFDFSCPEAGKEAYIIHVVPSDKAHTHSLQATDRDEHQSICILGIISFPSNGVRGAVITPRGVVHLAELKSQVDVSSFFLSDVALTEKGVVFVWAFELTDGTVFCWCASSELGLHLKSSSGVPNNKTRPRAKTVFEAPSYIKIEGEDNIYMGTVSLVGNSTMWMQDCVNQNRPDILIGCVPYNNYGCTMRVGQGSKTLHRMVPEDFDYSVFPSSYLDHDLLGPSDTVLTTPAFVVALVHFLLSKAYAFVDHRDVQHNHHFDKFFQQYTLAMRSDQFEDPFSNTLKILILRFVEMIASNSTVSKSTEKVLASLLYRDVVILARESLFSTKFANLLVGLGRQVEASCVPHLFPVPIHDSNTMGDTVEDLLGSILQQGSLLNALSILPLLSSKSLSLETCKSLLQHCCESLISAISTSKAIFFDNSINERAGLVSLARFGMQLEDMDNGDAWEDAVLVIAPISVPTQVEDGGVKSEERIIPKRGKSRKSSSRSFFSGFYCRSRRSKHAENDVSDPASALITSSFPDSEFIEKDSSVVIKSSPEKVSKKMDMTPLSIAEILSVLISLIVNTTPTSGMKWTRLSLVGQILLGDCSTTLTDLLPADTSDFMDATEEVTLGDLVLSVTLWSNQVVKVFDSKDFESVVVEFLVANFLSCEHELSKKCAAQLLDLILLLFSRFSKEGSGVTAIKNELLLIGVVAGHVADRIDDVFDSSTHCPLFVCYELAEEDSEGTI